MRKKLIDPDVVSSIIFGILLMTLLAVYALSAVAKHAAFVSCRAGDKSACAALEEAR